MRALPAPVLAVCPLQTLPDWCRRPAFIVSGLANAGQPLSAETHLGVQVSSIWLDLVVMADSNLSSLRGLHSRMPALRLCTCCRGGLILYRAVLK